MYKLKLIAQTKYNSLARIYDKFCNDNKINSYSIFIATTAITRPHLHSISFNNYKKIISKDLSIKWIINLDYVKFNDNDIDDELELTKQNILEIFKDFNNIDFEFIMNQKGNFNKAVRNITEKLSQQISKNCQAIFYLEDDWISLETKNYLQLFVNSDLDILKLYKDLDPNPKISFQPSIIRPLIWYYMFYKKLLNYANLNIDPEKICQVNHLEITQMNFKYKIINKFNDIGREPDYANDNLIRGWYQLSKNHKEDNISLSYIYIDKLIYSMIYILSKKIKKKLLPLELSDELFNYIKKLFTSELRDKILFKFKNNKDKNYDYYLKCYNYKKDKINLKLEYVYHHIDNLIDMGA
jgi:hypothetical protein